MEKPLRPLSRFCYCIRPGRLRKTTKNVGQHSQYPGWDSWAQMWGVLSLRPCVQLHFSLWGDLLVNYIVSFTIWGCHCSEYELQTSRLWCRVWSQVITNVSEETIASIFIAEMYFCGWLSKSMSTFILEDGGDTFHRNVSNHVQYRTSPQPRSLQSRYCTCLIS
jgi:hypothetical protein